MDRPCLPIVITIFKPTTTKFESYMETAYSVQQIQSSYSLLLPVIKVLFH